MDYQLFKISEKKQNLYLLMKKKLIKKVQFTIETT